MRVTFIGILTKGTGGDHTKRRHSVTSIKPLLDSKPDNKANLRYFMGAPDKIMPSYFGKLASPVVPSRLDGEFPIRSEGPTNKIITRGIRSTTLRSRRDPLLNFP